MNEDESLRCVDLGISAYREQNYERAKLYFNKSLKLHKNDTAQKWLDKINLEENPAPSPDFVNSFSNDHFNPPVNESDQNLKENQEPTPQATASSPPKSDFNIANLLNIFNFNLSLKSISRWIQSLSKVDDSDEFGFYFLPIILLFIFLFY